MTAYNYHAGITANIQKYKELYHWTLPQPAHLCRGTCLDWFRVWPWTGSGSGNVTSSGDLPELSGNLPKKIGVCVTFESVYKMTPIVVNGCGLNLLWRLQYDNSSDFKNTTVWAKLGKCLPAYLQLVSCVHCATFYIYNVLYTFSAVSNWVFYEHRQWQHSIQATMLIILW